MITIITGGIHALLIIIAIIVRGQDFPDGVFIREKRESYYSPRNILATQYIVDLSHSNFIFLGSTRNKGG